jgi:uncharacterized protein YndB with AHSA1/START domain
VLISVAIGAALPQNHTASRERPFPVPPNRLYDAIARVADYPKWKTGVRAVEVLRAEQGKARFREIGDDAITYEIAEANPPSRFVTRIADKSLPYGGSWTYELSAAPAGTQLRLTESGEVYNPIFRFVSRFLIGPYRTMDRTLDDLTKYVTR